MTVFFLKVKFELEQQTWRDNMHDWHKCQTFDIWFEGYKSKIVNPATTTLPRNIALGKGLED